MIRRLVVAKKKLNQLERQRDDLQKIKHEELLARLTQDDDKDDAKQKKDRDAAEQFEETVKDLISKLADDLGPVAEEVRKALERSVDQLQKSLDKDELSADDVGDALSKAHDEMRRAFDSGGPVEKEAREAWRAHSARAARIMGPCSRGAA